jgi:hypothetical protein
MTAFTILEDGIRISRIDACIRSGPVERRHRIGRCEADELVGQIGIRFVVDPDLVQVCGDVAGRENLGDERDVAVE